jgi:hypothetical protein
MFCNGPIAHPKSSANIYTVSKYYKCIQNRRKQIGQILEAGCEESTVSLEELSYGCIRRHLNIFTMIRVIGS